MSFIVGEKFGGRAENARATALISISDSLQDEQHKLVDKYNEESDIYHNELLGQLLTQKEL
jgi:hypothetical protein